MPDGRLLPTDLIGGFFRVHFNLRTHVWSVSAVAGLARGRVVANVDDITLARARMIVSEAGLRRVKEKGHRAVHAWVCGTVTAVNTRPDLTGLTKVSYNPRPKDEGFDPFFRVVAASGLGPTVTEADWLLLAKPSPDAPKGYAWLRRPVPQLPKASSHA
ncbi:hypothetical protein [Actinomadura hibisca]|uniref:hypothetical protein n=1 Tax=Actinomadura hibisca TaxID=68565 RepID=UPI00082DAFFA|nr:hypothetical protein [Actinomadura hibisca]